MTHDQDARERLLAHCDQLHDDDGVDPRNYVKRSSRGSTENRKAKQLCRQVAEVLDLVLSGACRDEELQCLRVEHVVPAPDSSRLLVTVFADAPREEFDREATMRLLQEQTGRLRSEVAASINRKRTPMLIFNVLGSPA